MIARGVNHISFPVSDLDRALAFYRDLLGLEPIPRPNVGVAGAWLSAGNAQVHLIVTPPGMAVDQPPPSLNPAASHAAFAVDDYAATLARLRQHGLDVLETSPTMGQMWVRDPDGHVIELIEPGARR
jgi:catechol 2,3-dioxygenase-like lactoylglutathione lyase family enzyme